MTRGLAGAMGGAANPTQRMEAPGDASLVWVIVAGLMLDAMAWLIMPPASDYPQDRRHAWPQPVYEIRKWPADLAEVPCEAWKKDDLGWWMLSGTLEWSGGDIAMPKASFRANTAKGTIIEKKCGAS
jgi:hypothetical protein